VKESGKGRAGAAGLEGEAVAAPAAGCGLDAGAGSARGGRL